MKGARPTRAVVDLEALSANLAETRRLAPGLAPIAVVKADAYGHGAVPVARRLAAGGCRHFAVMTLAEAAELRGAALDAELLVLGGVHDAAEAADALELRATPVLHHESQLGLLAASARERGARLAVHVEVDTGMRRMGIPPDAAPALLARVAAERGLALAGVYTHLACADDPDLAATREQLARFAEMLGRARAIGVDPGLVHVANSAALLAGESLGASLPRRLSALRPGLMLYGVRPAPHLPGRLRPALTLRTRVANVRPIAPGEAVGYGASWRAPARGRIATLPLGYADGVPWSAGSRGFVWHRDRRLPYAGRVSMDLVTVYAADGAVEVGDEVVVLGGPAGAGIPVEEAARAAGTIAYELLVRIGARVPREYTG